MRLRRLASGLRSPPAIISGAGLSHWAPASLPTGAAFHLRLRAVCVERAAPYVADIVDDATVDAIRTSRLNLLARVENTCPGAGAGALRAMAVCVPNEAHLLAALHLSRGGLHVTTNFDDGIERAYDLLAGRVGLPVNAAPDFHDALRVWRRQWPAAAPPLRAIWRERELTTTRPRRPSLVKLHGTLGFEADGLTLPASPMTDEPDPGDLGDGRRLAVAALADEPLVLVTGLSADDFAVRVALLGHLERGRFWWVTAQLDADVHRAIAAIDATQPTTGEPLDALRAVVPVDAPAWPRLPAPSPTFDDRVARWAAGLPHEVAAEALAWALADAGHPAEAVEVLHRLVRAGARARTTARLADALLRRRYPGDRQTACRLHLRAAVVGGALGAAPGVGRRAYSLARWCEAMVAGREAPSRRLSRGWVVTALVVAIVVGATAARARRPTGPVRCATVACGAVLSALERDLPVMLRHRTLRHLAGGIAVAAAASGRRVLRAWAHVPSGRRRALLERQVTELVAIGAVASGTPPPPCTAVTVHHLAAVFVHVADHDGYADALGTFALALLAGGDVSAATAALTAARRASSVPRGVTRLVEALALDASITVRPRPVARQPRRLRPFRKR